MRTHLLSLLEIKSIQVAEIMETTEALKKKKIPSSEFLRGRTIGLIFQKPSNRTRVSFHVGINQLGGHCLYLGPDEINLGVRESTCDVAQTLSRYLDGMIARVNNHKDLTSLAKHSTVPVINGLSDLYHPCQGLTDVFSVYEKFGTFDGLTMTYIGDGNNVCHSLILACAHVGLNIHIASPVDFQPDPKIIEKAQKINSKISIKVFEHPVDATKGTNVIYSDVWISMGQEEEAAARREIFKPYQINKELVKHAAKDFIFMHCLPAHRGEEVTADVIDGKHSIVFDQAENRLHTQKAIMKFIFKEM